jgi:hypothetical protein
MFQMLRLATEFGSKCFSLFACGCSHSPKSYLSASIWILLSSCAHEADILHYLLYLTVLSGPQ